MRDPTKDEPVTLEAVPEGALEQREAEHLRKLAYWLDDRFRLPGTDLRVGLDGLIGLVPGIGDAATTMVSLYIVLEAWRLGVPTAKLLRMGGNVGVDAIIGAVPVVGDLFDFGWKSNRRNIRLLLDHLEERQHAKLQAAERARVVGGTPR